MSKPCLHKDWVFLDKRSRHRDNCSSRRCQCGLELDFDSTGSGGVRVEELGLIQVLVDCVLVGGLHNTEYNRETLKAGDLFNSLNMVGDWKDIIPNEIRKDKQYFKRISDTIAATEIDKLNRKNRRGWKSLEWSKLREEEEESLRKAEERRRQEKENKKKIPLQFMVVPEELAKRAYVPDAVKVKIIDSEAIFLTGLLGESGRKLVLAGVEFYFEGNLARKLIEKNIAEEV